MIGINALHLNEATITEAVQEWLDKRMPNENQLITSVQVERDGACQIFVTTLTPKEMK
jgi:hypothetical protein